MAIHNFSEIDDLKKAIENDLVDFNISAARFPIRFIFLNSHEELKEIVDLLIDDAKKIELSSFLLSENSWFSVDQILNEIEKINENSVIVPLSEYIRFLEDENFQMILKDLALIENKNFKLYIPLVGLWERFDDLFWKKFDRKEHWAPVWKLNTPNKQIKIYQVNFEFNDKIKTNDIKLVSTTKQWFELWKTDNIKEVISLLKSLSIYFPNSLPDFTFVQEIIDTPKDYLSKIFEMNINIQYNEEEKEYWDKLLIDVSNLNKKNISLRDIFTEKFFISDISVLNCEDFLNYYLNNINNRYNQWLIKNIFIESRKYKNTYLAHCFKSMKKISNNNLARKIFLEIFKLDYNEDFLTERRNLLSYLNKFDLSFAENELPNEFKNIEQYNYKQQLNYLTSSTLTEKSKIIEIVQKNGLTNIMSDLKVIFPDLYHYLDWNLTLSGDIQPWIFDYFKEYNSSKVLNFKSEKLNSILSEKNSPDNFYEWYFDTNKSFNDSNNYVIWIDALGAEWLPLLTYYLNVYGKNNNKHVTFKSINSVNLPSATEFNKVDADKKIGNLDEYIHKNHYNYPQSLLDEMEYIKEIAKSVVKIDSPKVSIVSDHGFSFLCTKEFGGYKKYTFESSKHEGRYMLWENDDVSNDDYMSTKSGSLVHENEKYIVPLKHISLFNTPSHEVHGGATPEEVLVPYIVLENNENSIVDYEIDSSSSEINVSMESRLPITISPEPTSLPLAICNNESLPVLKEENHFVIKFNSQMSKGTHKIIIKIDDEEVGELEITVNKGGMAEENYDDLFN
ncbi:MAG: BREX-4 system phosphatase PglZ [Methanobrevibacter sp.]|nr:BREX-4 system phosphatase PglZ [Methanobrevibacter sp.]